MQYYIVEGYNKSDYIANIVNYEMLAEVFCLNKAIQIMEEYETKGYSCRIKFEDKKDFSSIIDPSENVHWEIFTGV